MQTTLHHDDAPDPLPYALAELEAYNQGWESRAVRALAFGGMRVLAVRANEWREHVGEPCVDAVELQAWVEDRIAQTQAGKPLMSGPFAWPPQCAGVPMSSVYDLLRKACRLEYDRHQRMRGLDLDALRIGEGDLHPEMFGPASPEQIVRWVMGNHNPSDVKEAA